MVTQLGTSQQRKEDQMKSSPGLIISELQRTAWQSLPNEQCGHLLKVLLDYHFDGVLPPVLPPELNVALSFIIPVIDKQKKDYKETCDKRRDAANKRWGGVDE